MSSPGAQLKVKRYVAQHPPDVTSQQVSDGCSIGRGWACVILAELVEQGLLSWRHGGGGTFIWSAK